MRVVDMLLVLMLNFGICNINSIFYCIYTLKINITSTIQFFVSFSRWFSILINSGNIIRSLCDIDISYVYVND